MKRFPSLFFMTTVSLFGIDSLQAQFFVDAFTTSQGPLVGTFWPTGDTVAGGADILGGFRTYTTVGSASGSFEAGGGFATIDGTNGLTPAFLKYDNNGFGLGGINLADFNSIVVDVESITGGRDSVFFSAFVRSPSGFSMSDFSRLHAGRNVLDLAEFVPVLGDLADLTNVTGVELQIDVHDGIVTLDSIDLSQRISASVGDRVWHDVDGNGLQDHGEPGIENATVTLLGDLDGGGSPDDVVATQQTDFSGQYLFDNLAMGNYAVQYDLPAGFNTASPFEFGENQAVDSNANPGNNFTSDPFVLTDGAADFSLDAGFFVQSTTIGDLVWQDLDRDGIQDVGEPGFEGATVNLLAPQGFTVLDTTTTDVNGMFSFDVAPGLYRLEYVMPAEADGISPLNVGDDPAIDSNVIALGNTFLSNQLINVTNGQNEDSYDAGFTVLSVVTGDFDADGDVDGFDFLKWQRGESPNPLSQDDLAAWETNYDSNALQAAVSVVPEPGSLLLALLCLLTESRIFCRNQH